MVAFGELLPPRGRESNVDEMYTVIEDPTVWSDLDRGELAMSKMKHVVAMLAPAGVSGGGAPGGKTPGVTTMGLGAFAAVSAASLMAPAAHAGELRGTWVEGPSFTFNPPFYDTFYLNSTQGMASPLGSDTVQFAVTNDTYGGYTAIEFQDANANGYVQIGYLSPSGITNSKSDNFFPALYNGTLAGFVLQPGTYTGLAGSTLTLTAVPEPDAWALMVAGAALSGGAARVARRRHRQSSSPSTAAMA